MFLYRQFTENYWNWRFLVKKICIIIFLFQYFQFCLYFITKKNTLDRQLIPKKLSNSSSILNFNFLWALSFRNDLIKARMFFFVLIVLFFLKSIAFLGWILFWEKLIFWELESQKNRSFLFQQEPMRMNQKRIFKI